MTTARTPRTLSAGEHRGTQQGVRRIAVMRVSRLLLLVVPLSLNAGCFTITNATTSQNGRHFESEASLLWVYLGSDSAVLSFADGPHARYVTVKLEESQHSATAAELMKLESSEPIEIVGIAQQDHWNPKSGRQSLVSWPRVTSPDGRPDATETVSRSVWIPAPIEFSDRAPALVGMEDFDLSRHRTRFEIGSYYEAGTRRNVLVTFAVIADVITLPIQILTFAGLAIYGVATD